MKRAVLVLAVVALVAPARAAAHATLVRTTPADGAVLDQAPPAVRITFDDVVRVAAGIAAVSNETDASVLDGRPRAVGRVLVIPLLHDLTDGVYSVRWSIASDDGHVEQGVLAFAVGAGSPSPHSVLGTSSPWRWNTILLRTLYFFGLLAAGGAAFFGILMWRVLGDRLRAPLAHLLFFALLAAFLGGSGIVHTAPPGTRFALVLKIAITVALAGGAAAALAPTVPALLVVAGACSLALLAAPPLSGHALDPDQPRVLAALADAAHTASAAVWLGGLLALVYVVPRASDEGPARAATLRRFSTAAFVAVTVLALTGLGRSLTELSAVHQVWSTSYGRALLVKTALFAPLLGLGFSNRSRLAGAFARIRRAAVAEILLLIGVVTAIGILTELRPGRAASPVAAAAPLAAARPAALPPRNAVVDAREFGTLAVAVARTPGTATVTIVGQDGTGIDGRRVTIGGAATEPCGSGCYRASAGRGALRVGIGGSTMTFDVPDHAPRADALLRRVTRAYRSSQTLVFDERLGSTPTNFSTTRFEIVAPHTLSYVTKGGPAGIVIGTRRWDRDSPTGPWAKSAQTPLDVTLPYWSNPTNVRLVAPGVVTLLDRRIPAWFRVSLAGIRPRRVEMAAAGHFMVDRYAGFDVPVVISPPSR